MEMTNTVTEILEVASFEIIGLTADSPIGQDLVFQELQSAQQYNDVKGESCFGQSPKSDQGYESDPSCAAMGWSDYSLTPQASYDDSEIHMAEELVSEWTYASASETTSNSHLPIATATVYNPVQLKIEPTDECAVWPGPQTFTQALENTPADLYLANDPFLHQLSTVPASCATQQYDMSEVKASEHNCRWSFSSSGSSEDDSVYAPSSNESSSSMDELEISDSEDVECQVTWSPMPHHEAIGNKGKGRRKRSSKQPILWRFLLDALNDQNNYGTMIQWVDKSKGTFQFMSSQKEELSKKWGEAKRNRCIMTYQKMARAMRNYINKGEVLQKVKKKLQYTFLPEFYAEIRHMVQ